jgi:hypothetical protein
MVALFLPADISFEEEATPTTYLNIAKWLYIRQGGTPLL